MVLYDIYHIKKKYYFESVTLENYRLKRKELNQKKKISVSRVNWIEIEMKFFLTLSRNSEK